MYGIISKANKGNSLVAELFKKKRGQVGVKLIIGY